MPNEMPWKTTINTNRGALRARRLIAFAGALLIALPAAAQQIDKRVLPLTAIDRQYMDSQRVLINEVSLSNYGGRCCRRVDELQFLQRLIDEGVVGSSDTQELQAMGVVMGDLLAAELDLEWVVYEDIQGRSRALRLGETDNYLFPVTMISRRVEGGAETDVQAIYQQAVDAVEAVRPPLPFQ